MKNENKNRKIAIYIAILIALLGGSFIIYKIASASINNAVIRNITMTSIETGVNLDAEDNLVITCDSEGKNCVNSYTASKDSSKSNILVKSFDKITYNFSFDVIDPQDELGDVEDATVRLQITLNGDDKKYVSFDENSCSSDGICVIHNNSSFETTEYSVTLNVNNAPNGYEIHPTFSFDVEDNPNDSPIALGYNTTSNTGYFYSSTNGTYSSVGPANYMPTIVSSKEIDVVPVLLPTSSNNSFTQPANYDGKDGRFITYLLGIKINGELSGSYYPSNEISYKVNFTQDGNDNPIMKENWIRFYGLETVDGIRPVSYNLPYSTASIGDTNKYIRKPGNISVTKDSSGYVVKVSNFEMLLTRPGLNANDTQVDGTYIATVALTNFSPRLEEDGSNAINNTITLSTVDGTELATSTIQNTSEKIASSENEGQIETEDAVILTSSAWYDETETTQLSTRSGGSGAVSKGTVVKYITKFKNNKTSANQGLKEVIKFDTYAYRVLPYDSSKDISIKIKCGKTDCPNISEDDFEVKYVTGTFDYAIGENVQYELADLTDLKLSNTDKTFATNACSNINLSILNKDQIQNLYGGPCIKAKDGVEKVYNRIDDAYIEESNKSIEIPIGKVILQTRQGVTIPDNAEVIVTVKARVRAVSDLTHNYQATTMISTSDYDSKIYYFAPQINDEVSFDNYIKSAYDAQTLIDSYGFIGDSLKIVNFTLRQKISVTNTNDDGSIKTKYRTTNNETIIYKVETGLTDNEINLSADDTWYIKRVETVVRIPKTLVYIPDDDLVAPVAIAEDDSYTYLRYLVVTAGDKIKSNMKIKDIYFKTKLAPTLSGKATEIVVESFPEAININEEVDTTLWSRMSTSFTIYGTGINEVIGNATIGKSGSLIEKNGTIDYVLNAYNNTGEDVNDYTLVDILPYNGDENKTNYTGSYSVKLSSDVIGLNNVQCTKVAPSNININDDEIWKDCGNIANEFVDEITAIRIKNISIAKDSYMGELTINLKTKDNKASDTYNNRFIGFTKTSSENLSNVIEATVINRIISGHVWLDNTGDSVKDGKESYVKEIPVTLYKVTNDGSLKQISETITDENGYYEFNNLDKGRYKIRAKYNTSKYDLALRYATEDTTRDSDAYQIDLNGIIEISDKTETSKGLVLYSPTNNITDMDIGLLPKHTFGFVMHKYITKIELSNNGSITTNTYPNLSTVSLSVKNPNKYTTKVYYGISITNNSNKAGYINLVKEDIPAGFIFDKNIPENAGWFEVDGVLGNRSLEDTIINPNETVYLQIVLFLPARDEAGTFINTASVAKITEYNPIVRDINDKDYINEDQFVVGDTLRYSGIDFHVIGAVPNGSEQILTLLADSDVSMSHGSGVYRWSNSSINAYLNNDWIGSTNINPTSLIPFNICDDASGLFNNNANGGVVDAATCASGTYTSSKVRLLTQAEFNTLINNLTDTSFLLEDDFWLMDAVYATETENTFDGYGIVTEPYDTSSLVKYVNASNSTVLPVQGNSGFKKDVNVSSSLQVRPVIRISTHDIILE